MTYEIDFLKTFSEVFEGDSNKSKIIQEATENVVQNIEKHQGFLSGPEKQKQAYKAMLEAVMMLVDVEGPIDDIIKVAIKPHLNNMIDWIVDSLNKGGGFDESNK